jgi:hypothetical protein
MLPKLSVKRAYDVDAPNAYTVIKWDKSHTVHTNQMGEGLWFDGKQIEGTSRFCVGKDPARTIRNYFEKFPILLID